MEAKDEGVMWILIEVCWFFLYIYVNMLWRFVYFSVLCVQIILPPGIEL